MASAGGFLAHKRSCRAWRSWTPCARGSSYFHFREITQRQNDRQPALRRHLRAAWHRNPPVSVSRCDLLRPATNGKPRIGIRQRDPGSTATHPAMTVQPCVDPAKRPALCVELRVGQRIAGTATSAVLSFQRSLRFTVAFRRDWRCSQTSSFTAELEKRRHGRVCWKRHSPPVPRNALAETSTGGAAADEVW